VTTDYITYEFPLNERMRLFIRLEQLFLQLDHFRASQQVWDKRATINTLVDILQIFSRHDLKAETLKELERHSNRLHQLSNDENVDTQLLRQVLDDLTVVSKALYAKNGKIDLSSIKSHLFHSITQRSSIPGGAYSFDLPAYHYWLQQPAAIQEQELNLWMEQFSNIRTAIELILQFLRLSGNSYLETAKKGFYQHTLDPIQPYQLVILSVDASIPYYAEISGGKHRVTTRFMTPELKLDRAKQTSKDISFQVRYCIF